MHILLANDDGFDAPGLIVLAKALREQHHKVTVVTTKENKSGCGMGISLRRPIDVEEVSDNFYIVDGTPADAVYIGLQNLAKGPVDLVVSGINNGANLGDDILYSGTFAAAMEARRLRLPSIALSIIEHEAQHYDTGAFIAVELTNALQHLDYKSLISVLNVNIPDVPVADLRGYQATTLGERLEPVKPLRVSGSDADTKWQYELGPAGQFDRRRRTSPVDFQTVEGGFVSVTPLSSKFEDRAYLKDVQTWLDAI